jgi:hypothetical protein
MSLCIAENGKKLFARLGNSPSRPDPGSFPAPMASIAGSIDKIKHREGEHSLKQISTKFIIFFY